MMLPAVEKVAAIAAGSIVAVAGVATENPWLQFGLAGMIVGVTIWQSWQRETRMATRIDLLEDRQDEILADQTAKLAAANERNIVALEQVAASLAEHGRLTRRLLALHHTDLNEKEQEDL